MSPAPRAIRATGAVLGALVALCAAAMAQTRPVVLAVEPDAPASAVYLDESFFAEIFHPAGGLEGHVGSLLRAAGSNQGFRTALVTISGPRLDWYDPVAFAMARTGPPRRTDVAFGPRGHRPFDIAIMTDCGACQTDAPALDAFVSRVRRDAAVIRRNGAQPVVFMAWADRDRPERMPQIAEAYTVAGNAAGAFVIPAGLAFARAREQRPALELHVEDNRHPNLAGTYLAAVMTYTALFGVSPIGNRYTAGLDAETAEFLQRVAWETAWDYYAGRPPE